MRKEIAMSNAGKLVSVHYRGTLSDGTEFDNSYTRGIPLEFECMSGAMIAGFDKAVAGMEVGSKVTITIPAAQAYGERDSNRIAKLEFEAYPQAKEFEIGDNLQLVNEDDIPIACIVIDKDDTHLMLDMNHELAGKDLTFEIELLEVK